MLRREYQRRADLHHVVEGTGATQQATVLAQQIDDAVGALGIGFDGAAALHDLQPPEKALAAHIGQERKAPAQGVQARFQHRARGDHVLLQVLALEHVENRITHRGRHRVATEGVEVGILLRKGRGDRRRGDHGGQGVPRADRFAQRDDIRHHARVIERPHLLAGAVEAGLHLVCDEQPARGAGGGGCSLEVARRRQDGAIGIPDGVAEKRGGAVPECVEPRDGAVQLLRVAQADLWRAVTEAAAKTVGSLYSGEPVGLLGGRVHAGGGGADDIGIAVVGLLRDDHALVPAHRARDADGEVVCFGARTDQQADAELRGHGGGEALGIAHHVFVEVTRVRIQRGRLTRQGAHHMRMTMSHRRHVVVAVQITPPLGIPEPHALAAHQLHRLGVEQAVAGAQHFLATRLQFCRRCSHPRGCAPAGHAVLRQRIGWIDGQIQLQGLDDIGPLLGDPRRRLLHGGRAEVVQKERRDDAQHHHVMQHLEIGIIERHHAVVGLELRQRVVESHAAVTQEARDHDREILHQRGMDHVAEIDHAADHVAGVRGPQQIARMTIGVHHLRPQRTEARQHLALEAHQKAARQRECVLLHAGLNTGVQHQGPLNVPGHEVSRMGVKVTAQTLRKAGLEISGAAENARLQRGAPAERLTLQPRQQPDHVRAALPVVDPLAGVTSKRGNQPGHRQIGRGALEVLQGTDLEIDSTGFLAGGGDLEDELSSVGAVDAVVLIALAIQPAEAALDAVVSAQRLGQGIFRKLRRIEVQIGGA